MSKKHFVVIDPGTKVAEADCFNQISRLTSWTATYHLPGQNGAGSILCEEPEELAGIIVFGGSAPILDPLEWREDLERWFQKCLDIQVPTLGLCWGHQWIGNLMGSEIGFAREDQQKMRGFRKIRVEKCGAFAGGEGEVVISHRSVVVRPPSNAKEIVLNSPYSCEALEYQDYPIYSFQSHPEATLEFLANNSIPHDVRSDLSFGRSLIEQFLRWSEHKVAK